MPRRFALYALLCAMAFAFAALAQEHPASSAAAVATASPVADSPASHSSGPVPRLTREEERAMRIEGEKRFRANCGRCHQPPHKFPPRIMATAIRHMRVRAMITDEDMRYILFYMTR